MLTYSRESHRSSGAGKDRGVHVKMKEKKTMIWYPYEQLKTMKAPYEIVDANGVYLYNERSEDDRFGSSWWSVIHGYKHPVINQAIISQVEKFSHVMLGGLTHEPARKLSEKLASWLPGDLDTASFPIPAVWRWKWR